MQEIIKTDMDPELSVTIFYLGLTYDFEFKDRQCKRVYPPFAQK